MEILRLATICLIILVVAILLISIYQMIFSSRDLLEKVSRVSMAGAAIITYTIADIAKISIPELLLQSLDESAGPLADIISTVCSFGSALIVAYCFLKIQARAASDDDNRIYKLNIFLSSILVLMIIDVQYYDLLVSPNPKLLLINGSFVVGLIISMGLNIGLVQEIKFQLNKTTNRVEITNNKSSWKDEF